MRSHRTKTKALACAGAALAAATLPASAASGAATSASASSAGPPAHTRVVVLDCLEQPQVRPRDFVLACADGNNALTKLHWAHWRSASATAVGRDVVNDCEPYCAAGHFHSYPVTVRLDRARPWKNHPGQWHYTRLQLTYPGARPAFSQHQETFPLWG